MDFSVLHGIILGAVQALTEFLPVSSSAHLIIARELFTIPTLGAADLAIDAVLQLGTILAVLIYFWGDLWDIFAVTPVRLIAKKPIDTGVKNLFWGIVFGTAPILVIGLLLEGAMETAFRGLGFVALFLFLGTAFMMIAEWYTRRQRLYKKDFTVLDGLWIGLAQVLALFSGFSRSGATISGGLLRGFSRTDAVRISFLLSFPAIALSGLKKLFEVLPLLATHTLPLMSLIAGFLFSAILGFVVIHYLLQFVRNHSFTVFIAYRIGVVVALLIFILYTQH